MLLLVVNIIVMQKAKRDSKYVRTIEENGFNLKICLSNIFFKFHFLYS